MGLEVRKEAWDKLLAFEDKVDFDVACRCAKIYAIWAAEQMGLSPVDSGRYAADMVVKKVSHPGFGFLIEDVTKEFRVHDVDVSENILMLQLDRCLAKAQQEIAQGV